LSLLFPGYSGLTYFGRLPFLAAALTFALLLDAFLLVNCYWTALLTVSQRNILLFVLLSAWVGLTVFVKKYRQHIEAVLNVDAASEAFQQAAALYLQRRWDAAETFILCQLHKNPGDAEFLLLQASLYRRIKRYEEALNVLERLRRLESGNRWYVEIETEKRLIREEQNC
jgi:tetratricopeptide (TPR) repeat protein